MWTSDLFSIVSPSRMQKHHMLDLPADDDNLSPRSECSSRSESPLPIDPISPDSPRSIFKSFWSLSKILDEEAELSHKLSSLQMPLVTADDKPSSDLLVTAEDQVATTNDDFNEDLTSNHFISLDDATVSYRLPPAPDRSRAQRRQILPTPPTSLIRPNPPCLKSCCRPWSSTSALIKKPNRSCLRPSRYSFCGSPSVASLNDVAMNQIDRPARSAHKKEVSFYAQVSVFEFTVPQEQRSDGWSKYFV